MSGMSKIDSLYRKFIITKFYKKGWGKPAHLQEIFKKHKNISDRKTCCELVANYDLNSVHIDSQTARNGLVTIHGHFETPLQMYSPNIVNPVIKTARFEFIYPKEWSNLKKLKKEHPVKQLIQNMGFKPVVIHMAGTGDHGFGRRRELLAKPLLKSSGIASLILENPYYGSRKPKEQLGSGLLHVTDLFVMGGCLILESQVLLMWLTQQGFGPLGLTGISMGGHMACLAATNWPQPISLVPCLSWTSSSVVWTEGVLSNAIPWKTLEEQLSRDFDQLDELNTFMNENIKTIDEKISNISNSTKVKSKDDKGFFDVTLYAKPPQTLNKKHKQSIKFMKVVMDQFTHLGNYSTPVDTSLATFVLAKNDAYYPVSKLTPMTMFWPDCEVRCLNTGHVAGFLMHQRAFEIAIADSFERQIRKYFMTSEVDHVDDEKPCEDPPEDVPHQKSVA